MSTRARTGLVTIAGVAASLSLVTLGEAQPPIRVGASMAQTGSLAVPGHNMLRGYRLCVKHANDKGGVLGRRIELAVEDDQSMGSTAVAIYEKLITQDKVDAILGPYSSPLTEAVADVPERHRMAMVAAGGRTQGRCGASG